MEIKQFILPLLRWWWLIIISTIIAAALSYFAGGQQTPMYRTRTTVMVGSAVENPNPSNNDLRLAETLATTYADIARRQPIKDATAQELGLNQLPSYSVRVVPNTQIFEITVADSQPQRAQLVANELVRQLILFSPGGIAGEEDQRQSFISQQLLDLETSINDTQLEIGRQQDALGNMFSARQISDTQGEIRALQNKLSSLRSNYANLLDQAQTSAINTINVIERANLPRQPVASSSAPTVLIATAVGFLLAVGAAYVLEYLDDTLKQPEDIDSALGLQTLALIPVLKGSKSEEMLVKQSRSDPLASEAFRQLRTNLQFIATSEPLNRLLITSSTADEGKSVTAANLGVALANTDLRVVLVDCDLHQPSLDRYFGFSNDFGLSTLLHHKQTSVASVLNATDIPSLQVLCTGPKVPNPSDLLSSQRMQEILAELDEAADIVVMDSPPVLLLTDASILVTQCDGVILVVKSGATRRDSAGKAVKNLQQFNANIFGVVLTHVSLRRGYYAKYRKNYLQYVDSDSKAAVEAKTVHSVS